MREAPLGDSLEVIARASRVLDDSCLVGTLVRLGTYFLATKVHIGSTDGETTAQATDAKSLRRSRLLSAACARELEKQRWRSV